MTTIITKNSSTASAVPTASDLVQGELAVNVTDKRVFTENASGTVVELGTNPSSLTLPNGTVNGLAFLNASKVLTTGSALQFDGTNLGLAVAPSGWGGSFKAIEFGGGNSFYSAGDRAALSANAYYNGSAWTYKTTGGASRYEMVNNQAAWYSAPSGTAGNAISFTQAMTLTAAGKLGVGTTGPNETIQANGTVGSIAASGSNGLVVGDFGSDAGTFYIQAISGRSLRFYDGNAGAERARIDSSGNLLVGVTADTMPNAGMALQPAQGNMKFRCGTANTFTQFYNQSNTKVGSIETNGTTTSYVTSSDYRLKENVQPMTGALSTVSALKPCTYTWKADGSSSQGFIAHELQAVIPECVVGEKDAVDVNGNPVYQGIDTSFLVATLTAAIQEQQAMIEQLKADVAALKAA